MKKLFLTAIIASTVSACAPIPQITRPPFNEAEYLALAKQGTGKIEGQVFMRTVGGDVKYGAGSPVMLVPITSYSRFWYNEAYVKGSNLTPPDPRQDNYIKTVQADGSGNFNFTEIPPGDYYAVSEVTWQVPTYDVFIGTTLKTEGGVVAKEVNVKNDETTRVMLTR